MKRRDFLGLCTLVLFSPLKVIVPYREFIHPNFGRFVKLTSETIINEDELFLLGDLKPYKRYIRFPIETFIDIIYKDNEFEFFSRERFSTFNLSQTLLKEITGDPIKFISLDRTRKQGSFNNIIIFKNQKFYLTEVNVGYKGDDLCRGL